MAAEKDQFEILDECQRNAAMPGRRMLLFATLALLFSVCDCAKPCPPHNESIDAYCDGKTAYNCRTTCGDCTDSWVIETCKDGCRVVPELPTGVQLHGSSPKKTNSKNFAICGEWIQAKDTIAVPPGSGSNENK
jgi:hypothetical protein